MGKVHVAAAVTLDGFLPDKKEKELWEWMSTSESGFLHCREKAVSMLSAGCSMMDLTARLEYTSNVYYAEISDGNRVELLRRLSCFDLIDEIAFYIFPVSYGQGIPLYDNFQRGGWKLCGSRTFRNGICRLVYRRLEQHP